MKRERTRWVVMMDWEYREEEGKMVEVSRLELIPLAEQRKTITWCYSCRHQ